MLDNDVQYLKGIGENYAKELATLGINTVNDLLYYFPYRYDVFEIKPLAECIHDDQITIVGKIINDPSLNFYGKRKSRLSFMIEVDGVAVKAVMFNRAFAKKQINPGDMFTLTGKWDAHRLQITVSHYQKGTPDHEAEINPVYSIKGKMTINRLKNTIKRVINEYGNEIEEIIPEYYLDLYKLPQRKDAIITMHYPSNRLDLKHARRRFIYEEFLLFQLKLQYFRKITRESTTGNAQVYDVGKLKGFIDQFNFTLTRAQKRSLAQILADMKSPYRMNRLLQGDVGSGKTAVAAIALYASVTAGKQGALMVPTEILAEQHYQSLKQLFGDLAQIELLTGSIKGKKRTETLAAIKEHDVHIVVGTHALIQDAVIFNNLGLVIVDEQHRFGVEQRRKLREKGLFPDVLFMTATPIPRTLAITTFGDMDVSIIDEMPLGRKEIETYWTKVNLFERVLIFIQDRVQNGEQAYVVCPLIEESDKLDIQDAVDLYEKLKLFFPKTINIGLMHGRLPAEEKDIVMQDFAQNKTQILISTTVVEVGVNVPNATVMVIYDAQRFGLSQLHQLRGRVGRGDKQSYCILIADPKGEVGKERMKIMTETNDGFRLSEHDLKLRGAGDFFGKKQSGLPDFKVADVVHDHRALEVARQDAEKIVNENLLEENEAFQVLKDLIINDPIFNEKLD